MKTGSGASARVRDTDGDDDTDDPGPESSAANTAHYVDNTTTANAELNPRSIPELNNTTSSNSFRSLSPHPIMLQHLLTCPICDSLLQAPTTLHCGHTLCSEHVLSLECPIPTCHATPQQQDSPNIPSSSRVAYYPAPLASPEDPPAVDAKLDITVSKIIALIEQDDDDDDEEPLPTPDDDSDTDEDPVQEDLPTVLGSHPREPSASPTSSQRPRKRRRGPGWRHSSASATIDRPPPSPSAKFQKDLLSELTCEICFVLLYQPVTTPCQHTFCAKCLQRSLDHSNSCPLCREDLPGFAYFQDHAHNQTLLAIILKAFPEAYAERRQVLEQEERDARLDTPIFVCQLSFPGMPTLLHFFEPRYRLMLRRCLESTQPRFGMIMPPRAAPTPGDPGNGNDYGTMLEIKSVQMLADGRSMVETWGAHRFRILERGTLDGYMVGRIERIDDYEEELDDTAVAAESTELLQPDRPLLSRLLSPSPPSSPTGSTRSLSRPTSPRRDRVRSNEELMSVCRAFLEQLRHGTAPWVVQRLNNTYGPMPTEASSFGFWVALVLPIDEQEKAKLLPIRSARLRLRLVVHWIEQLNSNWWFTSGCVIL